MWHKALECTSDCTVVILGGQGKGSSSKNQFTNNFGHSSWWLSHQLLNVWTNWIMFARLRGKHVTSKVIPCISLPPRKKHMLFPHHPPTTLSPPQKKKTLQRFVCFLFLARFSMDGERSRFLPWQCGGPERSSLANQKLLRQLFHGLLSIHTILDLGAG